MASVHIPATVDYIDPAVFQLFPNATAVQVAEGNPSYKSYNGMIFGKNDAGDPTDLLLVPEGMEGAAVLPNSLAAVPACVFSRCIKLSAIEVPIGSTVSALFASWNGILYNSDKTVLIAAPAGLGASATIAAECIEISEGAFFGNASLRTIVAEGNVEAIADSFEQSVVESATVITNDREPWEAAGFKNFADPIQPGTEYTEEGKGSGVTFTLLDDYTLAVSWQSEAPEKVEIPSQAEIEGQTFTVSTIAAGGFANQANMIEISIPSSVTAISEGAFEGSALVSVNIPGSVVAIGANVFANCTALTNVTLNEGTTTIGESAFAGTAIQKITLPASIKTVGDSAFAANTNLDTVLALGEVDSVSISAFSETHGVNIYVPMNEDEDYAFTAGAPAQGNHLMPYGIKASEEPIELTVGDEVALDENSTIAAPGDIEVTTSYKSNVSVTSDRTLVAKQIGTTPVTTTLSLDDEPLAVATQTAMVAIANTETQSTVRAASGTTQYSLSKLTLHAGGASEISLTFTNGANVWLEGGTSFENCSLAYVDFGNGYTYTGKGVETLDAAGIKYLTAEKPSQTMHQESPYIDIAKLKSKQGMDFVIDPSRVKSFQNNGTNSKSLSINCSMIAPISSGSTGATFDVYGKTLEFGGASGYLVWDPLGKTGVLPTKATCGTLVMKSYIKYWTAEDKSALGATGSSFVMARSLSEGQLNLADFDASKSFVMSFIGSDMASTSFSTDGYINAFKFNAAIGGKYSAEEIDFEFAEFSDLILKYPNLEIAWSGGLSADSATKYHVTVIPSMYHAESAWSCNYDAVSGLKTNTGDIIDVKSVLSTLNPFSFTCEPGEKAGFGETDISLPSSGTGLVTPPGMGLGILYIGIKAFIELNGVELVFPNNLGKSTLYTSTDYGDGRRGIEVSWSQEGSGNVYPTPNGSNIQFNFKNDLYSDNLEEGSRINPLECSSLKALKSGKSIDSENLNKVNEVSVSALFPSDLTAVVKDVSNAIIRINLQEPTKYTVAFNSQSGSAVSSQTIYETERVSKPDDPTRPGYTFDGWYKEAACTNAWDFNTEIDGDTTLYAKWNPMCYTIRLYKGDGTNANYAVYVKYGVGFFVDAPCGTKLSSVSVPTWTGHTFKGYPKFADENGKIIASPTDFTASKEFEDIPITAVWDSDTYTVTFNTGGGSSVTSQTISYGGKISEVTSTRAGYRLDGWYTTNNFAAGTKWDFANGTVSGNMTLYAKWVKQYTITFEPNGGTFARTSKTYDVGEAIDNMPAGTPQYADDTKKFSHWSETKDGSAVTPITTATADKTYYACWVSAFAQVTIEHYAQKADRSGYVKMKTDTVEDQQVGDDYTAVPSVPDGFHENTTHEDRKASGTVGDSGLVLKLYYDRNVHTVSYAYTGTYPNRTPAVPAADNQSWYGKTVTVASVPKLSGYSFKGWTAPTGVTVTNNQFSMPDSNVEFTGSWSADPAYFDFYIDGTKQASMTISGKTDDAVGASLPAPSKTGYTFDGWYSDDECTQEVTSLPGVFPAGTKSYYGKWVIKSYNVTFDANGGAFADGSDSKTKQVEHGSAATVPVNADGSADEPTRADYTFAGWSTKANGTSKDAITFPISNTTKDATYYAIWTINQVSYQVRYVCVTLAGTEKEIATKTTGAGDIGSKVTASAPDVTGYEKPSPASATITLDSEASNNIVTFIYTAVERSISFDGDGGKGGMADGDKRLKSTYGEALPELPDKTAPSKRGYHFNGWWLDETQYYGAEGNAKLTESSLTVNVTLKAKWVPVKFKIEFQPGDGGSGTMEPAEVEFGVEYSLPECGFTNSNDKMSFVGWRNSLTGAIGQPGDDASMFADEEGDIVTLVAQWAQDKYTITFDANGGSFGDDAEGNPIGQKVNEYAKDALIAYPAEPTRAGYVFAGWTRDGQLVNSGNWAETATADATYMAEWNQPWFLVELRGGVEPYVGSVVDDVKQATSIDDEDLKTTNTPFYIGDDMSTAYQWVQYGVEGQSLPIVANTFKLEGAAASEKWVAQGITPALWAGGAEISSYAAGDKDEFAILYAASKATGKVAMTAGFTPMLSADVPSAVTISVNAQNGSDPVVTSSAAKMVSKSAADVVVDGLVEYYGNVSADDKANKIASYIKAAGDVLGTERVPYVSITVRDKEAGEADYALSFTLGNRNGSAITGQEILIPAGKETDLAYGMTGLGDGSGIKNDAGTKEIARLMYTLKVK